MGDEKNIELSIVIPCLNEEKTLPIVISKSLDSFRRLNINGEVVIADNGSTDNSIKIAEENEARVVHCPKKGYGNALICGFSHAYGKYLIMGDADDSYNFSEIDEFVRYLREGNEIVMGTRLKGKIEKDAMPFLHRYLGTPVLTFTLNLFFGTKISDCNCGMRGLTKKAFEKLDLHSSGMEFASEMIIKAGILKLKIKEIPITLYKDKRDRPPHLHTWRDGWRHLKFMLLYAPNFVFIWPAVLSFALGTLILLLQINGPFSFGNVYMDIHSMIFGLTLSIVGISIFEMGMIIKLFSHLNNYYSNDRIVIWMKKISLEKNLIAGSLILLAGIISDIIIFIEWADNGFHNIQLSRLAIFGLYFIFIGISFISFSFLRAVMERE
jgi:glycosyltransferase involved in cell wall biosynthesis